MGTLVLMFCCFLHLMRSGLSSVNTTEYVDPEYLDMLLETERYEEFSKLLQIDDVDIVRPSKGDPKPYIHFVKGNELGDILLRPWQVEESRQALNQKHYPRSRWQNSVVPYSISTKSYTSRQYNQIQKVIENWNSNIGQIKFRRKSKRDRDYVMIFNGNGCFSNLGKVGGPQVISIQAPGCTKLGLAHHEMMHTIGFLHEQNRPDRDEYIKVLYDNIPNDWKSQYVKTSPDEFNILAPYDYYSIMHYGITAPETDKPAFEVLKENVDLNRIGQRDKMTPTDQLKINRLYG